MSAILCLLAAAAFSLGDISAVAYEKSIVSSAEGWKNWGLHGVRDFAKVLSKVSGNEVKLVSETKAPESGVVVYVGDTAAARAEGLSPKDLKRGEWRLVTRPGKAFILANNGMAASYGCTDFLGRYADYYFLTLDMDDPFVCAPKRPVPVADVRDVHAMYYRCYYCWGDAWVRTCHDRGVHYTRRTGGHSGFDLEPECLPSRASGDISHTYFNYCPPEKYAKDHPQYYSLGADGKRHFKRNNGSQLCLTNPEVFEIVYASLLSFIEKDRREKPGAYPAIYDFSQMDNCPHLCLCESCRKVCAKYDRKGGHADGGDAGLQLEFVNRLARKVREKYPDVIVRTFAYVSTEEPPRGIVPEPNVMIWLCDLYSQSDNQLPLKHPFNRRRYELLCEWAKLTKHIEVWDYYLCGGIDISVDAIASDVRLFRDLGITRVYNETHYRNQPFFTLNYFVTAELYRNPDRDLEELVSIWCRRYGKGAAGMKKAIDFMRRIIGENPPKDAMSWHSGILPYKTAANFEKFLALLRAAYAKETEGMPRGRMAQAMAETCRELMNIYRRTPGADAQYAAARESYLRYAPEGIEFSDLAPREKTREAKNYARAVELAELYFDDLPAVFKGVPRDQVFCLDYRRSRASRAKAKKVSDGVSGCAKTIRWCPAAERKPPYTARLIDEELRTCVSWDFTPVADGRYHWIRIGIGRIHRNSWIGFPFDNSLSFRMPHLYIECDGMDVDPNWYEFWVSCRLDGPVVSDDPNTGLFFDRLAMRRVPPRRKGADGKRTEARDDDVFK